MKCRVKVDMIRTGENIAKLRREKHLTVRELQDAFGFSTPQAIFKWQRGETLPSLDNLVILAEVFGVSIAEILMISRPEDDPPQEILTGRKKQFRKAACAPFFGGPCAEKKELTIPAYSGLTAEIAVNQFFFNWFSSNGDRSPIHTGEARRPSDRAWS